MVGKLYFKIYQLLQNLAESCLYLRGAYNKFPDFLRIGTFIDSTHMKLLPPSE